MYMRYLGIDYGLKKVGVAASDEEGRLAFPKAILPNDENLLREIAKICKEEKIEGVVFGESRTLEGNPNKILDESLRFKRALEQKTGLPVYLEKEFMTTLEARRTKKVAEEELGRREKKIPKEVDASAAALILQRHLDKVNQ